MLIFIIVVRLVVENKAENVASRYLSLGSVGLGLYLRSH